MSHEILQTQDGTFAMAYRAGDPVPWHAPETDPQTFEPGAAPEIILDAARLNYEVDLFPNCRPTGEAIEDSFHIARTETGKCLAALLRETGNPFRTPT